MLINDGNIERLLDYPTDEEDYGDWPDPDESHNAPRPIQE